MSVPAHRPALLALAATSCGWLVLVLSRLLSQGLGSDGGPRPPDVPTRHLGRWGRRCGGRIIDCTTAEAVAATMGFNTDRRSTAAVVAGQGTGRTAVSAQRVSTAAAAATYAAARAWEVPLRWGGQWCASLGKRNIQVMSCCFDLCRQGLPILQPVLRVLCRVCSLDNIVLICA